MVCSLGKGRMATMVRFLGNGHYSEVTEEEVSHQKLAAQSICRELLEADEANLLEEEDMHIFDCRPMVDSLHLVCCNNCKKPVKASQFAAHADCCRSLNYSEVILLEPDGGTVHKKPPRKGRKKSQTAHGNPPITVGGRENFGSKGRDDTTALDSIDEQIGSTPFPREAKRNSASIGVASVKDCSLLCPGSTNHTAVVMSPSEKRTKLITAKHLIRSEGLETSNGVNYQMTSPYPPVPLATKMYHSQRNMRLRFALNHLYHEKSTNDHCSGSSKLVHENIMLPSQVSSFGDLPHDPQSVEDSQEKVVLHFVMQPLHPLFCLYMLFCLLSLSFLFLLQLRRNVFDWEIDALGRICDEIEGFKLVNREDARVWMVENEELTVGKAYSLLNLSGEEMDTWHARKEG